MSYFISAPDAITEYGIGPAQLLAVITQNLVTIYDRDKGTIGRNDEFNAWVTTQLNNAIQRINRNQLEMQRRSIPRTRAQELTRSLLGEQGTYISMHYLYEDNRQEARRKYSPERLLRVHDCLFFEKRELVDALTSLFPNIMETYYENLENIKKSHQPLIQPHQISPMLQGGSRPETDKITSTTEACAAIVLAITQGHHLSSNNKIGVTEFEQLVREAMMAKNNADMFQKTAARSFFKSSEELQPFKRRRGEKT